LSPRADRNSATRVSLSTFLGLTMIVVFVVQVLPQAAWANACDAINHTNIIAYQTDAERRGVAEQIHVGGPETMTCFRVSSAYLRHSFANQIEIGWSLDKANVSSCPVIDQSSNDPWLFRTYNLTGPIHCAWYPSQRPKVGDFESFKIVRDATYTSVFHTFWKLTEVGAEIDMIAGMMSFGWAVTNAERFQGVDAAWGDFQTLEFKDSTGWHPWNSPGVCFDNDNGFDNILNVGGSADHVKVSPVSPDQNYGHFC
jgi:hypothetical protein